MESGADAMGSNADPMGSGAVDTMCQETGKPDDSMTLALTTEGGVNDPNAD